MDVLIDPAGLEAPLLGKLLYVPQFSHWLDPVSVVVPSPFLTLQTITSIPLCRAAHLGPKHRSIRASSDWEFESVKSTILLSGPSCPRQHRRVELILACFRVWIDEGHQSGVLSPADLHRLLTVGSPPN